MILLYLNYKSVLQTERSEFAKYAFTIDKQKNLAGRDR